MAHSYLRTPSVERLPHILEELHTGSLRIPPFQRDFEWTGEQRLALCSSIKLGLPTGSVMVWRTSHKLDAENPIGPFPAALTQPPAQYLLDGRQRMTTLYAALAPSFWTRDGSVAPSASLTQRAPDGTPWAIVYDLDQQEFVFAEPDTLSPNEDTLPLALDETRHSRPLLPLAVLLDDSAYDDWRHSAALSREQVNRARALRSAFSDYLIPIVPLATDDIGVVTLTFKRVNSGGTPMGDADMTRALAWSEGFDLRERLEEVREQLRPLGWGELEDDAILKVVAAVTMAEPTEFDAEKLAERIKAEPMQMKVAAKRLASAVRLLSDHIGIRGPGVLPYTQTLVFATRAINACNGVLTEEQERKLVAWVSEVCLDERFGGAPPHMIRAHYRALSQRLGLPTDVPRPKYDKRSSAKECWIFSMAWARSRGTALVLAEQNPTDSTGKEVAGFELIAQHGDNVGMLFVQGDGVPDSIRKLIREKQFAAALRSPANRVVCPPRELPALRAVLLTAACPPAVRESHLIGADAHAALQQNDVEGFFELRRDAILNAEREWILARGGSVEIVKENRPYSQG